MQSPDPACLHQVVKNPTLRQPQTAEVDTHSTTIGGQSPSPVTYIGLGYRILSEEALRSINIEYIQSMLWTISIENHVLSARECNIVSA